MEKGRAMPRCVENIRRSINLENGKVYLYYYEND